MNTKSKSPMIEDVDSQKTALVQLETLIPYHQRLLLETLLQDKSDSDAFNFQSSKPSVEINVANVTTR